MANFWFKFEWDSWRNDPQLRRCSKETRGFWIDCIAAMEALGTFFLEGTPEEICREVVADRGEFDRSIAELSRHGAATVEKNQEVVKVISRRLLKKANLTEYNRLKQQEHRSKVAVNIESSPPSKDIEIKSLRTSDSPIGEVQNTTRPEVKAMLPLDFRPPYEMWDWARVNCPALDLEDELDEFITFWRDIATKNQKRTLRGWNATWKGRMKERQEKAGGKGNGSYQTYNGKPTSLDRIEEHRGVIDQYPTEAELRRIS
jgi:hypothetical protein